MTTECDQWTERWTPLPAPFTKYEVFSDGYGPDQRPVRRIGSGDPLSVSLNNNGYPRVKPYDDDGNRQTKTVHSLVLLGFAGPCPPGMESRHLDDDPLNNRWRPGSTDEEVRAAGGNLIYGTKRQQHFDKVANGNPPVVPKSFPCVNHARCGGMVANAGSRCLPCAAEVGTRAAEMLRAGVNLGTVTRRLGYKSQRWVHGLARDYGGYTGTLAAAQAQRQPWARRVAATVRHRIGLSRTGRGR